MSETLPEARTDGIGDCPDSVCGKAARVRGRAQLVERLFFGSVTINVLHDSDPFALK